jgi:hypothetical protein
MVNLSGVILGWLLGILGQRPIIYIQQSFKKPAIKKSIIAELMDLRFSLATTSYLLSSRVGEIDKKYLEWIHPILKSYDGFYADRDFPKRIDRILQKDDKELAAWMEIEKIAGKKQGLMLKNFNVPFLDNNYEQLSMFDLKFQKDIFEVLKQIKNMNEDIDRAWFYFTKTFDSSISAENAKIISDNLESTYGVVKKATVNLSNNITAILESNLTTGWSWRLPCGRS